MIYIIGQLMKIACISIEYSFKNKMTLNYGVVINPHHNLNFNIGRQFEFQKKQKSIVNI